MDKKQLASFIDSAVLGASATESKIRSACSDAKKYKFFGLDVNLCYAALAKQLLKSTQTKLIVVIGYPLGATSTQTKMFESLQAIRSGANELDVVLNIGLFKSKYYEAVKKDIQGVIDSAKGIPVKIIIETGFLTNEEIAIASKVVRESGAQFIKTCSGYGPRGVSVTDIKIIRTAIGKNFGVKASGNVSTAKHAIALLNAGATRIGSSNAKNIIDSMIQ